MAVYAIGDVHGCLGSLQELLQKLDFSPNRDRLWFLGDLISRGPDSLGVVRLVQDLGDRAVTLMGNHEVRAVAGMSGEPCPIFQEHMGYLLEAPDSDALFHWMRQLPLWHEDPQLGFAMTHAGIHPGWSLAEAARRADELHRLLADPERTGLFFSTFGRFLPESEPLCCSDPFARMRFDITVFTRIRLCSADGRLLWPGNLKAQGVNPYLPTPDESPYQPWYKLRRWQPGERLLYGHWAAAGHTPGSHAVGLDSGCVYGGCLTAMRLDHPQLPVIQVECPAHVLPD